MKNRMMKAINQSSLVAILLLAGAGTGLASAQETDAPVAPAEEASAPAAPAPTKIGVIDVRSLVSDSEVGKQALLALETLRDQRGAELETASQALEQLQTQITEGRLSLSQERLSELNRDLEDQTTSYRRSVQDAERQLQEAQAVSFGTIEREVLPLIREIGDEHSFAVILSITDGGVVYAPSQVNITDLVVQRYNAQKASEATAATEE